MFFVGGKPGVANKAVDLLKEKIILMSAACVMAFLKRIRR
jgi:UDP-N-acetyl-D-mannosaminuronic acid transferase (WecB/TagA/CpsF family)